MNSNLKFIESYLNQFINTIGNLDKNKIDNIVLSLKELRKNKGRLYFLGVGGSAANASHAVNDFRKLCGIESYSVSDNISELSARINDEGWDSSYIETLKVNNLNHNDGIFIFSVGGGSIKKKISMNIVNAIKFAKKKKIKIYGIVGPNGGYAYKSSNLVLKINIDSQSLVTPISESFQSIVWHLIVSHPLLQINKTKW